jgi:hypothetical protein
MKLQIINIVKLSLMIMISVITFIIIKSSLDHKNVSKFSLERIDKNLKSTNNVLFDYEKIDRYLKTIGIKEMLNKDINPTQFIIVKLIMALVFIISFFKFNAMISVTLGILGFFIPDIVLRVSNTVDNEEMLPDIKRVYDTLRIQTKAGVFLTMSLTECYLVVKSPRLKKALLELNNYIITKNDIEGAIEEFKSKFQNTYIDTFCIVIGQSIESGRTVQILQDLSTQIKDIEEAMNIKLAERVKTKLEGLQFLIYVGVIGIIVYGIFTEILKSLTSF